MMEQTDFCGILSTFCQTILVKYQEPMASHTSFRIGGPSQAMAFPKDEGELSALLALAAKEGWPVRILGAGTNVLAPDEGLDGLTVCLKDCLDGMKRVNDREIEVMAGVTMTRAAVFAEGKPGAQHDVPGVLQGAVPVGKAHFAVGQDLFLPGPGQNRHLGADWGAMRRRSSTGLG